MFNIDRKLYEENSFLRDIKQKYTHFGYLTDKQIEAFKRVVKEIKKEKEEKI